MSSYAKRKCVGEGCIFIAHAPIRPQQHIPHNTNLLQGALEIPVVLGMERKKNNWSRGEEVKRIGEGEGRFGRQRRFETLANLHLEQLLRGSVQQWLAGEASCPAREKKRNFLRSELIAQLVYHTSSAGEWTYALEFIY